MIMMIKKIKNKNRAFVILFAVTISAILLAIALGVANIAFREVRFSTDARDTNDAFFAADTGAECALFYDKLSANAFTGGVPMNCSGGAVTLVQAPSSVWNFVIAGLGSLGKSCVKVTVNKNTTPPKTTVTSKGYNSGGGGAAPGWTCNPVTNSLERELIITY